MHAHRTPSIDRAGCFDLNQNTLGGQMTMHGMNRFIALPLALSAVAGTAAPATAFAQDGGAIGLEEIVVTAQKRTESLLEVPLSLQALSGEALVDRGVQTITDLETVTPNLVVSDAFGFYNPFLRGIGSSVTGTYTENSVAVYVDDVPRPRMTGSTSMVNLERVEILKGPQGALYGRNATGGAINIITREPEDSFTATARASVGKFSTRQFEGYIGGPLSHAVSMNVSASLRKHDPFEENRAPGGIDIQNQDVRTASAKLNWQVTDEFKLSFRADYIDQDDAGGFGWHQRTPGSVAEIQAALAASGGDPLALLALPPTTQRAYFLAALFPASGVPGDPSLPQLVQAFNPNFDAAAVAANPLPTMRSSPDFGHTYMDQDSIGNHKREKGASIKADWSLPAFDFTSITGYREVKQNGDIELDATDIPFLGFTSTFDSETWTQEFRVLSKDEGRFTWLAGVSYFRDRNDDQIVGQSYGFAFPPGTITAKTDVDAYAGFVQATYDLTEALSVTGSVRYSHEKKEVSYPGQLVTLGQPFKASKTESKTTPALTIDYKLGQGGLVYARYAQGFKSGGINSFTSPFALGVVDANGNPVPVANKFDPEEVNSFEVGYKGAFLDDRVRFSSAAFYYDYKNLQVQRVGGPSGGTALIVNADKARVYGLEADLHAKMSRSLTASLSLGLLDTKYQDFKSSPQSDAFGIPPFDNDGNQMLNAPDVSASVGLDYVQPIGSNLQIAGTAIASYRSKFFFDAEETPDLKQPGYWVANFRLGLRSVDQHWGVYGFVDNAFDKHYLAGGQSNAAGVVALYSAPRVYGITFETKW
jgi:iron complex outermembrane receptor protein